MKLHYHVIENTPGYMPESDPYIATSLKDAGDYALSLARELREGGYIVSGTKRTGYYGERDSHDLGRVITISDCYEQECLQEEALYR